MEQVFRNDIIRQIYSNPFSISDIGFKCSYKLSSTNYVHCFSSSLTKAIVIYTWVNACFQLELTFLLDTFKSDKNSKMLSIVTLHFYMAKKTI